MGIAKSTKSKLAELLKFIPDKMYIQVRYFLSFHRFVNFKNPQTYNEKLQWLKVNMKNDLYQDLVDKIKVREYVEKIIGKEYLVPVLGVWDRVEDIDFDSLPERFVLKCTHDSGSVYICKDKSKEDFQKIRERFSGYMKRNLYYNGREWPYKNLTPRVYAEEYLEDSTYRELRDYKLFCFNGVVKMFKIDWGRFTDHRANYYDTDGNLLPFDEQGLPRSEEAGIKVPETLKSMIESAQKLIKGFPFARVDFYDVNGKVYFGEITFFPGSGFRRIEPVEWDYRIGQWIVLGDKTKE